MMAELRVSHRIYTHAVSGGVAPGAGYADAGNLDLGPSSLDQFIESVTPGEERCFAIRRVAYDVGSAACAVVSYGSLVTDGKERAGVLTHARLAYVADGRAYLDALEIVQTAFEFDVRDILEALPAERVDRYVERIRNEDRVSVREWSPAPLDNIPTDFAISVLSTCVRQWNPQVAVTAPLASDHCNVQSITAAWSALPHSMQMSCPWAVGANRGSRVRIIFMPAQRLIETPPPPHRDLLADYLDWLKNDPVEGRRFIEESTANTGEDFLREIRGVMRSPAVAPAEIYASAPDVAEELDMSKKNRSSAENAAPANAREGIDPEVTAALNRQIREAGKSLERYVEDRLQASLGTRGPWQGDLDGFGTAPLPRPALFVPPWLLGTAFAVVLVALGYLLWRVERLGSSQAELVRQIAAVHPPSSTVNPKKTNADVSAVPAVADPAVSLQGARWMEKFRSLTEIQPLLLARALDALASNKLAASPNQAKRLAEQFEQYAAKKEDYPLPDPDRRHKLRRLLFEHVITVENSPPPPIVVDGDLSDLRMADLRAVKSKLHLTNTSDKVDDEELQAEAVIRYTLSLKP